MKVLHVAMRLDPAIGGSTSATVTDVIAEQRVGLASTVVFAYGRDDDERSATVTAELEREGVMPLPFPRLPWPVKASAQFGLSLSGARWLRRHVGEFDLVHAHGPWGGLTVWALVVARRRRVPTVLTAMTSLTAYDRATSQSRLRALAKGVLWRVLPALCDVIVYTSELELRASPVKGRLATEIVWHGVVDETKPVTPCRRASKAGDIVVGYLGRFGPEKNLPVLIETVGSDERLRLLVAGSGPASMETHLRRCVAQYGAEGRVEFLGQITAAQRADFFSRIHVLALPSTFENFGMAPAEAMHHGIPVVVSTQTGLSELIESAGGGVVVSPTVESLRTALIRVGQSAYGSSSPHEVALRFLSFEAHGRRSREVYEHARRLHLDAT